MRDKVNVCKHYVCFGEDCNKGFKNVDLTKCKNCKKYAPRKTTKREEPVKHKRQKDKDRHDPY